MQVWNFLDGVCLRMHCSHFGPVLFCWYSSSFQILNKYSSRVWFDMVLCVECPHLGIEIWKYNLHFCNDFISSIVFSNEEIFVSYFWVHFAGPHPPHCAKIENFNWTGSYFFRTRMWHFWNSFVPPTHHDRHWKLFVERLEKWWAHSHFCEFRILWP